MYHHDSLIVRLQSKSYAVTASATWSCQALQEVTLSNAALKPELSEVVTLCRPQTWWRSDAG